MSTPIKSDLQMRSWTAPSDLTGVCVDLRVELIGRKKGFRIWAGRLQGDNVPEDLVGKVVTYAPSPSDGLLAATVGNEPPFIISAVLLRIVAVEQDGQ